MESHGQMQHMIIHFFVPIKANLSMVFGGGYETVFYIWVFVNRNTNKSCFILYAQSYKILYYIYVTH